MELTKEKIKSAKNTFNIDMTDVILFIIVVMSPISFPILVCILSFILSVSNEEFLEIILCSVNDNDIASMIIFFSFFVPVFASFVVMCRGDQKENELFDIKEKKNIKKNDIEKFIKENDLKITYISEKAKMFFNGWSPFIVITFWVIAGVITNTDPDKNLISYYNEHPEGFMASFIGSYIVGIAVPIAVHFIARRHEWHDRYEILKYCEPTEDISCNTTNNTSKGFTVNITLQPKVVNPGTVNEMNEDEMNEVDEIGEEKSTLQYKGYTGSIITPSDNGILYGMITNIKELVSYEGRTIEELTSNFHRVVEDYIKLCENR